MNLIQIQEHLKDLPTQAIMSYANGQNPQVPPYMALGEMNRRKSMEQRAAQAPDSSVKEKLESELAQQVGLPGVGQGMNMRINPAGMPQPVPSAQPQMAPQMPRMQNPPMARPTPPQQMSQPGSIPAGAPGMAAGGLAELPVRKDIFNYAPGGIVAFADEGLVPAAVSDEAVASGGSAPDRSAGIDELPVGLANKILADRLQGNVNLAQPVSRDQVRAEVLAKKPELAAIIDKIPGDTLTKLASQLEQQNLAQRSKFQEGEGRQGLAALSQALIAAGEATRGQKGMGGLGAAFGGFGKSYNAATAAQEERAAKQQALERAQTIETMKLQSDIEQMQRAFAEGRVDEAMKYKDQINARKAKIAEIQGVASKDVMTLADKQRDDIERARHNREVEKYQQMQAATAAQRARFDREDRPTAEDKKLTKVMSILNADPEVKSLLKRREGFSPGDPEFDAIQDVLDGIRDAAFKDAKLPVPTKRDRLQAVEKPAEPGFFKKMRMSDEDKQALEWANANPKDPRSKEIKSKLGF
jgi:hypothetical protein